MPTFEADELMHYGVARRSGRYPWGSGEQPFQNSTSFLGRVQELQKQGMSQTDISKSLGLTTSELRAYKSVAIAEKKHADILQVKKLKDKAWSNKAIMDHTGLSDGTVRNYLKLANESHDNAIKSTSDLLIKQVDEKGMIDVGRGVSNQLGISDERLKAAILVAEAEGYQYHTMDVVMPVSGYPVKYSVLTPPGTTRKDAFALRDELRQIDETSFDMGKSYKSIQPPMSISDDRVKVKFKEEGGADEDGLIYLRRGVDDVSIGDSSYAQVRIKVNDSHYIKGVAIYKDDMPDGVDIVVNSNKSKDKGKLGALKKLTDDPDNPFGSQIAKQILDDNDNVKSAANIIYEEGDWENWSKNLPSQMLSKQSTDLARSQLDLVYSSKKSELDEIMSLTNPTVRKKLLDSYSDDADAAAVHMKAAALPRQATRVILPVPGMKDNEIYAPTFRDGERVALIRFPHAGTFEIPELTVNNRNKEASNLLKQAKDAVGINSKVAEKLSGADFDGDSVLVIPNNNGRIKSSPSLEQLKNFSPDMYAYPSTFVEGKDFKKMTDKQKGTEMGKISNLITDMTIKGADVDEIARAAKHSMVVIDAQKHDLNYKQSSIDNGIPELHQKYQGISTGSASTLVSRAKSKLNVDHRKARTHGKGGPVDPETGKLMYEETGLTYTDPKTGKLKKRITQTTKLAEADDAHKLSSGSKVETLYADHSNKLKALANTARKESLATKPIPYDPVAKKKYSTEVAQLDAELNRVYKNKPKERQAQSLANTAVSAKRKANPHLDDDDIKKLKTRELANARLRVNSDSKKIVVTDKQWEAIQSGAISPYKLSQVLDSADLDVVKQHAMPRTTKVMSPSKAATAKAMLSRGYTQAEVADAMGVSASTISDLL